VIVADANLLIYAYDRRTNQHEAARTWLESALNGIEPFGIPWISIGAFLRLSTDSRLPGTRLTPNEAADAVNSWAESSVTRFLSPGQEGWRQLRLLLLETNARGGSVTDVQIAALTIEHGGVLHTADRDFARFPGLRWRNPLL
jgi:toxin-antitoxin system PIN domain toxin